MNAVPWGDCYIFFAVDGGAFVFGTKPFLGSLGDDPPDTPIVSGDAWFGEHWHARSATVRLSVLTGDALGVA